MLKKSFIFLIYLLPTITLYSQSTPKDFFDALVNNKENVKDFVDENELIRSERLGITYSGVKNKCLLANDIQEIVKQEIHSGNFKYEIHETPLEDNYSSVYFVIPQLKDSLRFYFYKGKYIAPATYFTRNWQSKESKYFIFKISEPKYFNDYCVQKLDEFADKLLDSLDFSAGEKELLQQQKIYYIFCKDEKEVGLVTGIRSKGQAMLAFDEVITAYQTHFHEVAHLIMNYKLKNLGLFTLPFFIEGFAVAMGGRGGMAPRVVTDIGYYLQKSGEMPYDSILSYESFNSIDAGITYSVAGLYNSFLMQEIGMKQYIELYKKVNGDIDFVKSIKAYDLNLPDRSKFEEYLNKYPENRITKLDEIDLNCRAVNSLRNGRAALNFCFRVMDSIVFFNSNNNNITFGTNLDNKDSQYESRIFNDISKEKYFNSFYLISFNSDYIKVYNCLNDELAAMYDLNFSLDHKQIKQVYPAFGGPGFFSFGILRSVFGFDISNIKQTDVINGQK